MQKTVEVHFGIQRASEPWDAEIIVRVRVEGREDGREYDDSVAYDWTPGEAEVYVDRYASTDQPNFVVDDYRDLANHYGSWLVQAVNDAINEGKWA